MLAEVLKTAEHGTTIEIAARCCYTEYNLGVETSVRLIGTGDHYIETSYGSLKVRWLHSALRI